MNAAIAAPYELTVESLGRAVRMLKDLHGYDLPPAAAVLCCADDTDTDLIRALTDQYRFSIHLAPKELIGKNWSLTWKHAVYSQPDRMTPWRDIFQAADAIVKLINSQPSTPTPDEIARILRAYK